MSKDPGICKLNNRGLSLVELIVAISIGVIVSASIAGLLTFSIRMYRNESANTSIQYELQSNINMIMDEIMGSQTILVIQNSAAEIGHVNTEGSVKSPYTRCALFGKFESIIEEGTSKVKFNGVVFVSNMESDSADGRFKVYMNRVSDIVGTDPKAVAKSCYDTVKGAFSTSPNPYLLGEDLVQFVIEPDPEGICFDESEMTYTNPIPVKVELSFERDGWGSKKYKKHVNDVTYLRNMVDDIHQGGTDIPNVYIGTLTGDNIEATVYKEYMVEKKKD
ncbi:MAG: prepilin-type N-terminal cleavage/methylation domain-containing protein [Lachnospiraceae bacterium]|nr:prepilin-type N-terminal cleavage/methylation domain-containing protein [Lachnospiraceae bacterium]